MNLKDGGKNRPHMKGIGMRGLKTVLQQRGLWKEGMSLDDARDIMWSQPDVMSQMTRIERLYYDNGIVCLYVPKAHPVLSAVEVL